MTGRKCYKRQLKIKRYHKKWQRIIGTDRKTNKQIFYWLGLIADLLKVGFSIRQAVNFSDVIYPRHRLVIREIQSQLSGGKSFAKSLRGIVPVDVYYQIYLAEQHGCLQTTLVNIYLVKKTQEANLKKLNCPKIVRQI